MRVRARADCHQELPDGRTNPSLAPGREYVVVGYDWSDYRLVADQGPCLYDKRVFDVVDAAEDPSWIRRDRDEGGHYVDPPECAAPGFYERWHDGDPVSRATFSEVYARLVAEDLHHGERARSP